MASENIRTLFIYLDSLINCVPNFASPALFNSCYLIYALSRLKRQLPRAVTNFESNSLQLLLFDLCSISIKASVTYSWLKKIYFTCYSRAKWRSGQIRENEIDNSNRQEFEAAKYQLANVFLLFIFLPHASLKLIRHVTSIWPAARLVNSGPDTTHFYSILLLCLLLFSQPLA